MPAQLRVKALAVDACPAPPSLPVLLRPRSPTRHFTFGTDPHLLRATRVNAGTPRPRAAAAARRRAPEPVSRGALPHPPAVISGHGNPALVRQALASLSRAPRLASHHRTRRLRRRSLGLQSQPQPARKDAVYPGSCRWRAQRSRFGLRSGVESRRSFLDTGGVGRVLCGAAEPGRPLIASARGHM